MAALPAALHAQGPVQDRSQKVVLPSCKQAVAQSRAICLSGSQCQREISAILRACAPGEKACAAAREDLRAHCSAPAPWDGTRECEGALRQVGHYCGR